MACEQSENPHYDIMQRVLCLLRCIEFECIRADEIYESEFPFVNAPVHGLAVSYLTERVGKGLSSGEDIAYGIQLTRVMRGFGQKGYNESRSQWRNKVWKYFHNKRINPDNICELITQVNPATIDVPRQWQGTGVDPSVMEIWVWVRFYPETGIFSGNTIGCDNC